MPRTMTRAKSRARKQPKKLAPTLRARKQARKATEKHKFVVLRDFGSLPDGVRLATTEWVER